MKTKIIIEVNAENTEELNVYKEKLKFLCKNTNNIHVEIVNNPENLKDDTHGYYKFDDVNNIKFFIVKFTNGIIDTTAYKLSGTDIIVSSDGKLGFYAKDLEYKDVFHLFFPNTDERWVIVNNPYDKEGKVFIFRAFGEKLTTSRTFAQRFPRSIRSDKLKCLYYIISKNCCSAVTNLLYKTDIDPTISPDWDPWDFNGNIQKVHQSSIYILNETQLHEEKLKDYRKFVILRDPIDRFLSLVNYTKDKNNPVGFPYMQKYQDITNKKQYIDLILIVMKGLMAIRDIWYHDDHFMAQKQHIKDINLDEIDDFVDIKDANDYFKEVYNLELPRNNVTKTKFITKDDLSLEQINEIKHLWAEDFDLLLKVKKWKRNKA